MPTCPPNLIYILGDDHRAEQLGCRAHSLLQKPPLDALARAGGLFTNAFCTPSRTSHYTCQWGAPPWDQLHQPVQPASPRMDAELPHAPQAGGLLPGPGKQDPFTRLLAVRERLLAGGKTKEVVADLLRIMDPEEEAQAAAREAKVVRASLRGIEL